MPAWLQAVGSSLLGGLFGRESTPESKLVDMNKIKNFQMPTQDLLTEQLGLSRQLRDPNSAINKQMQMLLAQNASNQGAQLGLQSQKLGAMTNMSPGQIAMQNRMASNSALGDMNNNMMSILQGNYNTGLGLLGQSINTQQGLDENMGNAYLSNLNMQNKDLSNMSNNQFTGAAFGFNIFDKLT